MKKTETTQDVLTVPEACALLRVSKSTLYKLCEEGLPHQRVGSGNKVKHREYRFLRAALLDWMAKPAA